MRRCDGRPSLLFRIWQLSRHALLWLHVIYQVVINCMTAARRVYSLVVVCHVNSKLNLIFDKEFGIFRNFF